LGLDVDNRGTVKARRHHIDVATTGAVVLGATTRASLSSEVSAGRAFRPASSITSRPCAPFALCVLRLRVSVCGTKEIVRSVLDVGERLRLQGWVLYATRDEIVAAFSRRREEFERLFRVLAPPWESVRQAWDKRLTYELARMLGVSVEPSRN
jgi:D-aspartate ligase